MDWTVLHKAGYRVEADLREILVYVRIKNSVNWTVVHQQTFMLPDSIHNRAKQAFEIATNHFVRNRLEA